MFEWFINNVATDTLEEETLDGVKYWKIPTAMICEGVWTANNGPLYYPKNVLSEDVENWNHKPIVIDHPVNSVGVYQTAATKDVLEKMSVGFVLNTKFDDKLRSVAYINQDKVKAVDERVYNAIVAKQPLNVSTGMKTVVELVANRRPYPNFSGKPYIGQVVKVIPDHLAILPDKTGACSTADGAGMFIANEAFGDSYERLQRYLATSGLTVNELSFDQIRSQLRLLLSSKYGKPGQYWDGYIDDVFDGFVVFYDEEILQKQDYSVKNSVVELTGTPLAVTRVLSYEPVTTANQGVPAVNKKQLVDALIANAYTGFTEDHRTLLEAWSEDQLKAAITPKKAPPAPTPVPVLTGNAAPIASLEDLVAKADANTQYAFQQMKATVDAVKAQHIQVITSNAKNQFPKEWLEQQHPDTLARLAAMAAPEIPVGTYNAAMLVPPSAFTGNAGGGFPTLQRQAVPATPKPLLTTDATAKAKA